MWAVDQTISWWNLIADGTYFFDFAAPGIVRVHRAVSAFCRSGEIFSLVPVLQTIPSEYVQDASKLLWSVYIGIHDHVYAARYLLLPSDQRSIECREGFLTYCFGGLFLHSVVKLLSGNIVLDLCPGL